MGAYLSTMPRHVRENEMVTSEASGGAERLDHLVDDED